MKKTWCKYCHSWEYGSHFDVPGCGDSDVNIRYHPESAGCGDVWQLSNGWYMIVDYKDSLCTGFTISNGEEVIARSSFKYTAGLLRHLESHEAKLISTFEEKPYPCGVSDDGWSISTYGADAADADGSRSLAFLKEVLKTKEENHDATRVSG